MKWIKYTRCTTINLGTEEEPDLVDVKHEKSLGYSESALAIAEKEAYNGDYTIEDDGETEPGTTTEERVAELEEALELILSGVTE